MTAGDETAQQKPDPKPSDVLLVLRKMTFFMDYP